jgi:hypothetical protein
MIDDINEIRALATKYSVQQLRNLADLKLLDPIKAVMAGNMINHIQKQNAKPPSTSVAQDLLGIQQQMPMQGQQQQQMPPQEMPQQAPPQMAQAPAGIEGLPAGDVGNYAGGGIVAFAGGGDTDIFGNPRRIAGRGFAPPDPEVLRQQLQQIESRINSLPPGRGRASLEQQRNALRAKLGMEIPNASTVPTTAPAVDQSAAETARLQRQNDINPFATDNNVPPPPPPKRDVPPPVLTSGKTIEPPTLGAFDPNAVKLTGPKMDMPKVEELGAITKEREAAEQAAGYNANLTKEQLDRLGVKEKKLEDFESRAGGEALFNFGLGLLGAKQGRELETVGKSGQAALSAYKSDVKDLRSAKEKLDERSEALRLADNQAKKTNSAADIAKRDAQVAKYDAAKLAVFNAETELTKTQAQVSATARGQDAQFASSMYTAQLSAQTQRDIARLSAETQRWVASRPPAEILAIEEVARRTGKPFDQAMKDFYGSRYGARNAYTREDAMKDARKNLENQGIINPTDAQMQAEINKQLRIYGGGGGGGGGTLQQGANGTFNYVPTQ